MRSTEIITSTEQLDENLRKWFKEKWVRFGPDGKIRGSCARGDDSEGKPKCLPQAKAHALGKKGRKYAASKKRREDPNPERRGPAKNVATKKKTDEAQLDELKCWPGYTRVRGVPAGAPGSCKKKTNEEQVEEKWSQKYKDSINCSNPKGFSQKAHCAGKKKDESMYENKCPHCGGEMVSEELMNEKKDACYYKVKSRYKVWPSAYASGALVKCRKKGAKNWGNKSESVEEGDKLQGTPVVSLKDFGDKDNTKNKYGQTVPKKLKKDDPRVKFHKDQKLDELSPETLASYKKKAGQQARELDKAAFGGDPDAKAKIAKANKRFGGIMKATKKEFKESHILQGIMLTEQRTYKLWESAGRKLVEAQLTADQIQQIFQQVEKGATAGGANRTFVGKGVDAASAVNKAWEDLKTKVQNSGPIKNVDAMYDKAAEKLKQATGGDQGVMKYVQKYRDFAKKHPVAQSLIYAALIAAAGISGAGLGGAAALGLFKMTDKLLQGEKFSSAAYSGAKTGAMAYGASQIGKALKGADAATGDSGDSSAFDKEWADANQDWEATRDLAVQQGGAKVASLKDAVAAGKEAATAGANDYSSIRNAAFEYAKKLEAAGMSPASVNRAEEVFVTAAKGELARAAGGTAQMVGGQLVKESVTLTPAQIRAINEGIMDTIKGAAGKAADWVGTKAKNITTKVTADKLMSAWKKAGSPTDSEAVAKVLQGVGISPDVIKQTYTSMKIPAPTTQEKPAAPTSSATATPATTPADTVASTTTTGPSGTSAPSTAAPTVYKQVQSLVSKLDKKGKQRIAAILKKDLGLAEEINEFVQGYNMNQAGVRKYEPKHVPNQNEIERMSGIMEGLIIRKHSIK